MSDRTLALVTRLVPQGPEQRLLVPALDRFAPEMRALAGLLPVVDINGALIAALAEAAASSRNLAGGTLVAGVFAADPFLDLEELAAHLAAAGLSLAANYPTLQHFDGTAGEGLSAVGYDVEAEFAALTALEGLGIGALACVASTAAAERALALGFRRLAFDPGPGGQAPSPRLARLAEEAGASLAIIVADEPAPQALRP